MLYFSGYQPTLAVPPLKKAIVLAAETQQSIASGSLIQPFILPHPGYISTRFSTWHPGLDIATGLGMPVRPVADGKVEDIVYGFFDLGHYVVIEHAQGYRSVYGHMGRIFVKKGETVTQSSILGEVGVTGRTTGPHTHLEMTLNGQYINPETILPTLSDWPSSAGIAPQGQGGTALNTPTPTPTVAPKQNPVSYNLPLRNLKSLGEPTTQVKTKLVSNYFAF